MEQAASWARRWIELSARVIAENREKLSDLDRHIGDGDHGENLARGFRAILEAGQVLAAQTGREVLRLTAKTLMSTVGGAAGPLYGTAYLRAAKAFPDCSPVGYTPIDSPGGRQESTPDYLLADCAPTDSPADGLTSKAIVKIFAAAAEGIQARGKAKAGEKTMVDAWLLAVAAARRAAAASLSVPQTLRAAADGATQGALATISMRATKGRASYLGERSVGHLDPGAKSSALIFEAAAQAAADIFEENQ